MGKPADVGKAAAAAAGGGAIADQALNNGQVRKNAIDGATNAVGGDGGSTATNVASTPTDSVELATGVSPTLLAGIFLVAIAVIAVARWLQE